MGQTNNKTNHNGEYQIYSFQQGRNRKNNN